MTENTKASIYKKIALVMGELSRVKRNGYNKQFNYYFATAEDIKDATRQAMSKHNLVLLMSMPEYQVETIKTKNAIGTKVRGNVIFTFACGETGETLDIVMPAEAIDYQDKVFSKLYTLALKYFLIDTFQISTGDENDPDSSAAKTIEEITPQPKPQSKQQTDTDSWPAKSGPLYEWCRAVRALTDYYQNQHHLVNTVGGAGAWLNDADEREAKFSLAIDHANEISQKDIDEQVADDLLGKQT